jgi:hypothetical protein
MTHKMALLIWTHLNKQTKNSMRAKKNVCLILTDFSATLMFFWATR